MNLLLVAVMLLQDKDAGETFKKIEEKIGQAKWLRVSRFKLGENDDKAKTLSYRLEVGQKARPVDVSIWFDPESFKLLKRKIVYEVEGGRQVTTTETYDEITFDAEIPEENFTLP